MPRSVSVCTANHHPALAGGARQRGFTLIELIMVIVMLGVLAVFAAPRMLNNGDISARGLHDRTLAYLRYAQKTAIAQRRTVCVTFNANVVSLRIANNAGVLDCAGANGVALNGADGKASTSVTGAGYAAPPSSFNFDGLGQPIANAAAAIPGAAMPRQTMQVLGLSNTITVEPSTGYVHE